MTSSERRLPPVRPAPALAARGWRQPPFGRLLRLAPAASFDRALDRYAIKPVAGVGGLELKALKRVMITKAQSLESAKSWTLKMLAEGLIQILKKVGEEAVEYVLAVVCADDHSVCSEAADVIYHVLLLLVAMGLSLNTLFDVIRREACWWGELTTLAVMERVAVSAHDATVSRRNAGVAAGGLLDSTAVLIASAFNKHVHRLCTLSMRLGTSAFVDVNAIYYAAYDVLLALMALLCSRRVGYWRVANVLCSRMFAEAASEQRR